MNCISININYLVKTKNIGNDEFGRIFGLNRGAVSSYIHGKSQPKIETLQKISEYYNISIDDLINCDLTKNNGKVLKDNQSKTSAEYQQQIIEKEKRIEELQYIIALQKEKIEALQRGKKAVRNAGVADAG